MVAQKPFDLPLSAIIEFSTVMFKNVPLKTLSSYKTLRDLFANKQELDIKALFQNDSGRSDKYLIKEDGMQIDFSKHRVDNEIMKALLDMAEEADLKGGVEALFEGERINMTENRAVLHTALRKPERENQFWEGENISELIHEELKRMKDFSNSVINGLWKGYGGKEIKHVVNIGIGGSDLGPSMVTEALGPYQNRLDVRFVSNVDGWHLHSTLNGCDPESTLFVVVSKTFTTQETMANATAAKDWVIDHFGDENCVSNHFIAVSTQMDKAEKFGIASDNVFGFWNWVGGRYSLWSSVGMSICLAVGFDNFRQLLDGGNWMDDHFRNESFDSNAPVILALLGIWYNNFHGFDTHAVLPYDQRLKQFPAYLQQADMESNGKSTGRDGKKVDYATGPVIWGEPGTNGQHAFYQLIHQGTRVIPVDFIFCHKPDHPLVNQHQMLLANCIAQAEALMVGKSRADVEMEMRAAGKSESEIQQIAAHRVFEGNRPSTMISFDKLTPFNLGRLIALYEHKIFVQGYLWNIFSYDQWGVELGKKLANNILEEVRSGKLSLKHDESTKRLIDRYLLSVEQRR